MSPSDQAAVVSVPSCQIRQVLRATDHGGHSSIDFLLVSDCVFYKVNARFRRCSDETELFF